MKVALRLAELLQSTRADARLSTPLKFATRINGCELEFDFLIGKYVVRKDGQIVGREVLLKDAVAVAKSR